MKKFLFFLIGSCVCLVFVSLFSPKTKAENSLTLTSLCLSGSYTIGGTSPDYVSFTAAVSDLVGQGICGPVVFNIRDGVYNEQVVIPQISGTDSSNTITFQSESGDSSLVILAFPSGSSNNYILRLDGADYCTFRNLSFQANSTIYGRLVEIRNESNHNSFLNSRFLGISTTNTSSIRALVFSQSNTQDEHNEFRDNAFFNGSYGFYWYGTNATTLEGGTLIEGNLFQNQYYRGIELYYQSAPNIRSNIIRSQTTYSAFMALYARECDDSLKVEKNHLIQYNNGSGLVFENCVASSGNPITIANNFISVNGTNSAYGIRLFNVTYPEVAYNNVNILGLGTTNSRAFDVQGGSNVKAWNNIFSNDGGGYAVYTNNTSSLVASDHNDFFTTGSSLAYRQGTGDISDLVGWQNASGFDTLSLSLRPFYASDTNLHVFQSGLKNAGIPIAGIEEDFDGEIRDASFPDIGADEFTLLLNDAGIIYIDSPFVPFEVGLQAVKVSLKNYGSSPLTQATIHWEVNGVSQPDYNWTGNLLTDESESVQIGTFTFNIGTSYEVRAFSSLPNGQTDGFAKNDSASVSGLYAALEGTYTLGGFSPDFASFSDAVLALNEGGVGGPVTIQVRTGLYNEQISLRHTPKPQNPKTPKPHFCT